MSADLLNHLQYSAVPWNMWRRDNPAVNVVPDGANLSGMILTGIDLSNTACVTRGCPRRTS